MSGLQPTVTEIRHLAWDSTFFGLRIARVEGHRLAQEDIAALDAWCQHERVDCCYFLADASAPGTLALAEAAGFQRMDERVGLEVALGAERPRRDGYPVRGVEAEDVPALEAIAGEAHRGTRFFNDGRFARERCVELYRTWIRNSCLGSADFVWVCEDAAGPTGYATCHLSPDGLGEIGLVGVAERARGQGYGQALIAEALGWLRNQRRTRAHVVTQGANTVARRLYERAGFSVLSSQVWYHRWRTESKTAP
jgi:dTDP-4-amino-4,6-dideoxy-D-galactose acyltransferase